MRFGERGDGAKVLAEHGRWIAHLRDDARLLEQRLRGLELRVNTLEASVAELGRAYGKLDLALAQLSDWALRTIRRFDSPSELARKRSKLGEPRT